MPFSGGLYPPLKRKSVYPPPIEAGVLGHLINQMLTAYCMKMRKDGIENIHNRLSNALIVQNTDRT
jgi:hypothetical protein